MYQRNASHTGYMPISLNPSTFSVKWERTIGTLDLNPVTAANGMVFVSEFGYFNNPGLYALDAETGSTLWSKQYGDVYSVNPPSYAYGNVYIQTGNHSDDTYLRAYKADTGDFVFRTAHFAQWERYYAPTIYDGSVYVSGGYYGGMYAFGAFTGEDLWFRDLPQYDQWTPAVDESYAYAYLGEYSPGLYVTDRFTGEPVFEIPDPDFEWEGWSMNLAPVLGGANDVLVIQADRLISFDLANRDIRWQRDAHFAGQPSVANGVIYAISSGALSAREQLTGNALWGWEPPEGSLKETIIVTNSHLFVRTSSAVYVVDIETHRQVWSYPTSGHLTISEDTLYIASTGGLLVAINYESNPSPDIKANGLDGPLTITQGGLLTVTVSLEPGSRYDGENADWWVAATSPFGRYWYTLDTLDNGWVRSDPPIRAYGGPLFDLSPYEVLNTSGLPVGPYTFHFGVDLLMNGSLDFSQLYYDSVDVTIELE
jgi:outer membrane protein assembly factor BamB